MIGNLQFPGQMLGSVTSHLRMVLLFALPLAGGGLPGTASADWPSFQNGGQLSLDGAGAPQKWEPAWSQEIVGYGQSSPVVWGDTVYVTSVSGRQKETYHVTAFDRADGTRLWQHDLANASPVENTGYVSRAAPTPAADADGLICFFEGGNVVALAHDGAVRWERNLVEEFGPIEARHGLAASVEQSDSAAFVWVERGEDPYVLAIEKATGQTRWKAAGLGATSWASPRLVPVDGGHHLVLSGIGTLVGLAPETGERLWTLGDITGNSSPTPMPVGDGRFLQGATLGRGESNSGAAAASNGLVGIEKTDRGSWQADYVWRARRATSSFGSPIAHAGHCYFVNATGVVYCLDRETGKERFAKRIGDPVWATPIAVGDQVLFFGKEGAVRSIASGARFEEVRSHEVWDRESGPRSGAEPSEGGPVLYGVAVVGDQLFTRSGNQLHVWRIR